MVSCAEPAASFLLLATHLGTSTAGMSLSTNDCSSPPLLAKLSGKANIPFPGGTQCTGDVHHVLMWPRQKQCKCLTHAPHKPAELVGTYLHQLGSQAAMGLSNLLAHQKQAHAQCLKCSKLFPVAATLPVASKPGL